jgi:hypothetical protein
MCEYLWHPTVNLLTLGCLGALDFCFWLAHGEAIGMEVAAILILLCYRLATSLEPDRRLKQGPVVMLCGSLPAAVAGY